MDGASGGTINGDVNITGKANIGSSNSNSGTLAFVAGESDSATGDHSVIGGGINNTANDSTGVVAGGVTTTRAGNTPL